MYPGTHRPCEGGVKQGDRHIFYTLTTKRRRCHAQLDGGFRSRGAVVYHPIWLRQLSILSLRQSQTDTYVQVYNGVANIKSNAGAVNRASRPATVATPRGSGRASAESEQPWLRGTPQLTAPVFYFIVVTTARVYAKTNYAMVKPVVTNLSILRLVVQGRRTFCRGVFIIHHSESAQAQ